MRTYNNLLKKHRGKLIWSPLLVLIFVICETTQPYFMSLIIDQGIMQNNWEVITQIGATMIGISLISLTANLLNIYLSSKVSVQFGTDLRNQLFNKIQSFALKDINQFQTSTLITRLTNDIAIIQRVVLMLLRIFLRAPLLLLFSFIFIIKINPKLSIIVSIAILILSLLVAIVLKIAFPLFTKTQNKLDQLNLVIQENLKNIRVVKSFAKEIHEIKKFKKSNEEHRTIILKAWDILVCAYPLMQLIINASIITVLWMGGNRVMNRQMQVGELIAIVNYFVQILMALMMLSFTLMGFARALASSKRIKEVLNYTPSIIDSITKDKKRKSTQVPNQIINGSIEFKNVSLIYNTNDTLNLEQNRTKLSQEKTEEVLKNISFVINPGETIALVGATGSGKSSLLHLIPRLYDTSSGEVIIDQQNVKTYSKTALRSQIGVVFQVNELFTGSLADNLRWGNPKATLNELKEACKLAEAHSFITQFKKGYETPIGRKGINLSGGQRQRICIARALLSQPKILLLDDCTSAVDAHTERKIWSNLHQQTQSVTTLIVTQRLHNLSVVNRVLVMENGTIVAFDTPQRLMKTSSAYQKLFQSQIYSV